MWIPLTIPWYASAFNDCLRRNVWLLTSAGSQQTADEFLPPLLQCRDLVPVLGVSSEPLLGPVDLSKHLNSPTSTGHRWCDTDAWIIVGGESGPGARPMHPDWARSIRDQCQAAGVPFFFKQWGEWEPRLEARGVMAMSGNGSEWRSVDHGDMACVIHRVGKKAAGRLLDGREWSDFPQPTRFCH